MSARFADARACGHNPEQHRHDDGQDADAASHDRALRELTAELAGARGKLRGVERERDRLADEHGAAGEVLAVVRDAVERIDRALARYDTQPGATPVEPDEALREALAEDHAVDALDDADADEPDDLRSPLAAERDQLVEAIGQLVSLPPEQIAKMHKVGYSGMSAGLGSVSPHAQGDPVATAEQALRDRAEHAIRDRLTQAWKAWPADEVFLDQVAAVAAVAAVNELREG